MGPALTAVVAAPRSVQGEAVLQKAMELPLVTAA
jgi:hypothetical protein